MGRGLILLLHCVPNPWQTSSRVTMFQANLKENRCPGTEGFACQRSMAQNWKRWNATLIEVFCHLDSLMVSSGEFLKPGSFGARARGYSMMMLRRSGSQIKCSKRFLASSAAIWLANCSSLKSANTGRPATARDRSKNVGRIFWAWAGAITITTHFRSEEHTSELQSRVDT